MHGNNVAICLTVTLWSFLRVGHERHYRAQCRTQIAEQMAYDEDVNTAETNRRTMQQLIDGFDLPSIAGGYMSLYDRLYGDYAGVVAVRPGPKGLVQKSYVPAAVSPQQHHQ